MRTLLAVALADWRERMRRPSFLVALGGAVYFGYIIEAGYVTLNIESRRGVMNSAWVGTLTALSLGAMLPIVGFYLVKNALERDRLTRVGEILAASPLSRISYVAGKSLSNFLYLAILAAVPVAGAVLLQITTGEDRSFDVVALLTPVLWLTLPALVLVATLAVLFETVRLLRGALGNLAFFALWMALLVVPVEKGAHSFDLIGVGIVREALFLHLDGKVPAGMTGQFSLQIGPAPKEVLHGTFQWSGLVWTSVLTQRLFFLLGVTVAVVGLGALFFDRFDPARSRKQRAVTDGTPAAARRGRFRLPHFFAGTSFGGLVAAELRLMLDGRNIWWTLGALGLIVAGSVAPLEAVRQGILPVAWLWPLAAWSGMGAREARHGTGALIFCSPRPLAQQALAIWTAGVLVTVVFAVGAGLRLAAAGDPAALLAWVAACLFIPSLALALGSWSGGTRLFECVYLLLWYIGPMNHVASFDFMGVTPAARASHLGWTYLAVAAGLLVAAFAGRRNLALRVR